MQNAEHLILALGGMRSGKTAWAEARALDIAATRGSAFYLATGVASDDEMTQRIAAHRASRADAFTTIEEPRDIAPHIIARKSGEVILIDSSGGWLTNLMLAGADIPAAVDALMEAIAATPARVIIVSEEAGLGVIPENRMARDFIDALGNLNRRLADAADEVVLLVAGIANHIKQKRERGA